MRPCNPSNEQKFSMPAIFLSDNSSHEFTKMAGWTITELGWTPPFREVTPYHLGFDENKEDQVRSTQTDCLIILVTSTLDHHEPTDNGTTSTVAVSKHRHEGFP